MQDRSSLARVSTPRFHSRIVGNVSAPLHSILSESHEDIEAESANVHYSNDPMSVMIISRQGSGVNIGDQEEQRQEEEKGLLFHGDLEEHIEQEVE